MLTNAGEPFASASDCEEVANDQEIAEPASWHRNNPHDQVWQRRVDAIVFDRELQHFAHVFRQITNHNIESPVVSNLRKFYIFQIINKEWSEYGCHTKTDWFCFQSIIILFSNEKTSLKISFV